MKNYSSKKAQKGRTVYRTPERFIYRKFQQVLKRKIINKFSKTKYF